MGSSILIRDIPGVISVWELQGKPFFSLWATKSAPAFSCADEDEGEREKLLLQYLDIIKNSNTTADYTIKFHDETSKTGRINNTTPVIGSITFRLNNNDIIPAGAAAAPAGGNGSNLLHELFREKLERLEDRFERRYDDQKREYEAQIESLQAELAATEEEEEEDEEDMGFLGSIGKAGEQYKWMQDPMKDLMNFFKEPLKDLLTVTSHKMKQHTGAAGAGPAISGVPGDLSEDLTSPNAGKRMNAALQTLIQYNTVRFAMPPGVTPESCTPEQMDQYKAKAMGMVADTLVKLTGLCSDNDMYDLAMKKLNQLL